jgi:hypothetical protein
MVYCCGKQILFLETSIFCIEDYFLFDFNRRIKHQKVPSDKDFSSRKNKVIFTNDCQFYFFSILIKDSLSSFVLKERVGFLKQF